ncbi:MAG: PDZ domain-containing protein [Burkholderiales bacterium]|nr:PDZ domain-containing protein [Anaerolineae bacterium]
MRKLTKIGIAATLAISTIGGAIFAQDTETTEATAPEAAAWLGVAVAETDGQVVIVRVLPQSPAVEELLVDDVIVAFDGTDVASASELSELVQAAEPGDTATLDLLREGEEVSADVTLGSTPVRVVGGGNRPLQAEMAALEPLDAAQRLLQADLAEADGGFEVTNVLTSHNPFALEIGDVVATINGQDITALDLQTLRDGMRNAETPGLNVTVERGGAEVTLTPAEGMGFGFGGGRGFGGGGGRGPQGGPGGNQNGGGRDGNGAPPPPPDGQNGGNDAPPAPANGAAI